MGTLAYPYPGKSTRYSRLPTVKKFIDWVLPGLELVLARLFRLTRTFMREDLPTLDLPAKAISGLSGGGYWFARKALMRNTTSIYCYSSPSISRSLQAFSILLLYSPGNWHKIALDSPLSFLRNRFLESRPHLLFQESQRPVHRNCW